jgi:hypothetical protein
MRRTIPMAVSLRPYAKSWLRATSQSQARPVTDDDTHFGIPVMCERRSWMFEYSDANLSSSFQSPGRISFAFVFQVNSEMPTGRGVRLCPCAKSSMTRPSAVAVNCLDMLPIPMMV